MFKTLKNDSVVGIDERNRKLNNLNDEIQQIKNELDERSLNMTDGSKIVSLISSFLKMTEFEKVVLFPAPLVNLKKVLVRIKGELSLMDVRIGVASHILLQSRLKQSTALQHLLLANSTTVTR